MDFNRSLTSAAHAQGCQMKDAGEQIFQGQVATRLDWGEALSATWASLLDEIQQFKLAETYENISSWE